MEGFLKSFSPHRWYVVLIALGAGLIALGCNIETKGFTSRQIILAGFTMLFAGLGEAKHWRQRSTIKPPNAYTGPAALVSWWEREPDLVGDIFFLLAGLSVVWLALSILGVVT